MSANGNTAPRFTALGYLRAFITLLVVAHHAVLAYHPYAPAPAAMDAPGWLWTAFPVVDVHRFPGVDLFVGFNDAFFMALMFLLSGLFTWPSLRRKAASPYVRSRLARLGVPFLWAAALVAPLAYYPAYLQGGGQGVAGFVRAWLGLGAWPAGPAWFLWVLLVFDAIAAWVYRLAPNGPEAIGRWLASRAPLACFGVLAVVASTAYLALALVVDPFKWTHAGPFFVQSSRVLLYACYFAVGVVLGAAGMANGWLAEHGRLARRWIGWMVAAPLAYLGLVVAFVMVVSNPHPSRALVVFTDVAFVVSGLVSSFAALAFFLRFVTRPIRMLDVLTRDAFGIYLLHYPFVTWLQFALLGLAWQGAVKGVLVFVGAVLLSWGTVAVYRRVRAAPTMAGALLPGSS
jgi:peptidoglycan/LPS O-acetylase OafA/YrhL